MKKIWQFLSGKKTIIGLGLIALCGQSFFNTHVSGDLVEALNWIGSILAGTGLLHKGVKAAANPQK